MSVGNLDRALPRLRLVGRNNGAVLRVEAQPDHGRVERDEVLVDAVELARGEGHAAPFLDAVWCSPAEHATRARVDRSFRTDRELFDFAISKNRSKRFAAVIARG